MALRLSSSSTSSSNNNTTTPTTMMYLNRVVEDTSLSLDQKATCVSLFFSSSKRGIGFLSFVVVAFLRHPAPILKEL